MMGAVRFAKRIGRARDRPLDAKGVGVHSIGVGAKHVRSVGSREGAAASRHRAVPCPRASLAELVDDRLRFNRKTFVGASLAVCGTIRIHAMAYESLARLTTSQVR